MHCCIAIVNEVNVIENITLSKDVFLLHNNNCKINFAIFYKILKDIQPLMIYEFLFKLSISNCVGS